MLVGLSVRDIVVIDRLDVTFDQGFCALTGETGAGKSILLDALGLALGGRADAALVRQGARQAVAVAEFAVFDDHPVLIPLRERGIDDGCSIALRRVVGDDGRSRAFVNDAAVTVGFLGQIGQALVTVYGQGDRGGLMDPQSHGAALDGFGKLGAAAARTREAYHAWQHAHDVWSQARADAAARAEDLAELRAAAEALSTLQPVPGEEAELTAKRRFLISAEKIARAVHDAADALYGEHPVDDAVQRARRLLAGIGAGIDPRVTDALAALDRVSVELAEAISHMADLDRDLVAQPEQLEAVESRLFGLRAAARKHNIAVDDLADFAESLATRLQAIEGVSDQLDALQSATDQALAAFRSAARALSRKRRQAAKRLDQAINVELDSVRLTGAQFQTDLVPLDQEAWGAGGAERISFTVATNPDSAPGPIHRVASGGELSRFMLVLRVVLAGIGGANTLIFDEIDTGIGGAAADAVGVRLAKLAQSYQVLVVTHQPQVAARANQHMRVVKSVRGGTTVTDMSILDRKARREEIARMLAGAEVTDEARAAAARLIAAGQPVHATS